MTGLGAGSILLFLLLYHTRTCHCNYADVLWGQCYAFCLTQHESRLYRLEDGANHGITVKSCRRDKVCKWCLHACKRPRKEYQDQAFCKAHCQKPRLQGNQMGRQACDDSCGFINRSFTSKFGSCPSIDGKHRDDVNDSKRESSLSGRNEECRDQCERDIDCGYDLKCCISGCQKKCLRIVELNYLPPIPDRLRFKTRHDGSTLVEWGRAVAEQSSKPVLYVLRWWCSYTNGVIATLTTKPRVRLKGYSYPDGLHPGQRCQFTVAAVNRFGSQGFSDTQQYTKKFVRPTKPGNLEMVRSKLHNDKVDVTIQWQPPIYTDNLPISRYLVLWSDPLPRAIPEYERRHMYNKTLDGDKTSYTISGLEPGIIYFVQVKAVVSWKKRSIRGRPVSTYLETYSIPRAVEPSGPDNVGQEMNVDSAIYNITVSRPAFLQSEVKAWVMWKVRSGMDVTKYMVYWVPEVCDGESEHRKTQDRLESEATTHKKEFFLYNLMSSCLYEIRIHAVNSLGEIDEGRRKVFQTPPCMETPGAQPEFCFTSVSPPPSPVDMSIRFKTYSSCVCQAVIAWRQAGGPDDASHPYHQQPHHNEGRDVNPATVWNIIWGQSRPPVGISSSTGSGVHGSRSSTVFQSATIVYNTSPRQTQIPGTETKACLTHLENSKHYTVQIVAQSGDVKGDPAVFPFTTPDDMYLCYTDYDDDEDDQDGGNYEVTTRNSPEPSSASTQANSGHSQGCSSIHPHHIHVVHLVLLTMVAIFFCLLT